MLDQLRQNPSSRNLSESALQNLIAVLRQICRKAHVVHRRNRRVHVLQAGFVGFIGSAQSGFSAVAIPRLLHFRRVERAVEMPVALDAIQRLVRLAQKHLVGIHSGVAHRRAHRNAQPGLVLLAQANVSNPLDQRFQHLFHAHAVMRVAQKQNELVAAVPSHNVIGTEIRLEQRRQLADGAVALHVPHAVVDRLQLVNVGDYQRERLVPAHAEHALDHRFGGRAVVHARHAVLFGARQNVQLRQLLLVNIANHHRRDRVSGKPVDHALDRRPRPADASVPCADARLDLVRIASVCNERRRVVAHEELEHARLILGNHIGGHHSMRFPVVIARPLPAIHGQQTAVHGDQAAILDVQLHIQPLPAGNRLHLAAEAQIGKLLFIRVGNVLRAEHRLARPTVDVQHRNELNPLPAPLAAGKVRAHNRFLLLFAVPQRLHQLVERGGLPAVFVPRASFHAGREVRQRFRQRVTARVRRRQRDRVAHHVVQLHGAARLHHRQMRGLLNDVQPVLNVL